MAASPTALEKTEALTYAETNKAGMTSGLTAGGHDGELVAQLVPVAWKLVVIQNPASASAESVAEALAATLKLEYYKES